MSENVEVPQQLKDLEYDGPTINTTCVDITDRSDKLDAARKEVEGAGELKRLPSPSGEPSSD